MKKGFTLMELIAVILIVGILAVIAIPKIGDAIEASREKTAEISMQNYLRAINEYVVMYNIKDGEYKLSEIDVEVSGKKPDSGTIVIENKDVSSMQFDYSDMAVKYDKEGGIRVLKFKVYNQGDIILYDVTTGQKCDNPSLVAEAKTGCLKFYVLTSNDNKTKENIEVILDHNTTDKAAWAIDYTPLKGVQQQLESDTLGWKVYKNTTPRIISAQELTALHGDSVPVDGSLVVITTPGDQYVWLYDNITGNDWLGLTSYSTTYGYWTSTKVNETEWYRAWSAQSGGSLQSTDGSYVGSIGIRPIITISKEGLE